MSILGNLFGSSGNIKEVRKLQPIVDSINSLEKEITQLSPEDLKKKTGELKNRLNGGDSFDGIVPEAFALVREASRRTLSQRHFDVQLIGGMVLHRGNIAEMKTGEGKTLTATLAAYINAIEGKGVHVVTVNDYLARRDAVWMGQIYYALGLSVGCIAHDTSYVYDPFYQQSAINNQQSDDKERDEQRDITGSFRVEDSYLRPVSRRDAYKADITYGTNNEFGFDYLRDNMAYDLAQQVQRGHNYAIIDEIDSILIDEARTPLIISAPDEESSKWYLDFAGLMPQLNSETDYQIDEKLKAVTLTESGINKVEQLLGVKDIYQEKGIKYLHHLEQALRAQTLFQKDKDYVVRNNEVIIVDEFTGRLLPGRRYSGGLHQALEAKESVKVQPESITLASITFQNYFRLYKKLSGMTGTAATSAEEFYRVYGLEVVNIPTNKPMVRKDLPDRVYKTVEAKFKAVAKEVKARHETGEPVLVGTVSIQKNEFLSKLLEMEGVPHNVLNAKNHEREAEIIAQAGKFGAVTVATNMAGRGVDIILGGNPPEESETAKVREFGGLHVIGTERHEARRIDNQLRGRSGRQGDPGSSQFYVSLEDDVVRVFGGERIKSLMERFNFPEDQPIESRMVSGAIESAQTKIEGMNFDARKRVLEYDDVLNRHRDTFYRRRGEILAKAQIQDSQNQESLKTYLLSLAEKQGHSKEEYEKKEQELGAENMRQAEKIVTLRAMDTVWVEHLENMESLRESVRLRAYGQQDPLVEYKNEGHRMFQDLLNTIDSMAVESLFQVQLASSQPRSSVESAMKSEANRDNQGSTQQKAPGGDSDKVGRNDPCPCGSGKKYKKCHGK